MAKIVSFNTDAPGLKPQSKPHDGLFEIDAQLQHASFGKGKDIQSIRVRAPVVCFYTNKGSPVAMRLLHGFDPALVPLKQT